MIIIMVLLLHSLYANGFIISFKRNTHQFTSEVYRTDIWRRKFSSFVSDDALKIKSSIDLPLNEFKVLTKRSADGNSSYTGYISNFMNPLDYTSISNVCKSTGKYHYKSDGGYPDAERRRSILTAQDGISLFPEENVIWAIEVQTLDSANNGSSPRIRSDSIRKALGSTLSIETSHFGDIVLPGRKNACQLFVTEEVVHKVMEWNTSFSNKTFLSSPIEYIKVIDLKDVKISPFNEKTLTINEASNRLDAVASGGFGISRNKMTKMIASEEVMIDWKVITNGATNVKRGQLIAAGDMGQVRIEELGITSKGRRNVKVTRRTRLKGPGSILS